MNLNNYIKITKDNIFFICAFTIIGTTCAYLSTSYIESGYKAQQTIFVKIEVNNQTTQDSADPQTTTDTVVAYISSQDFQKKINEKATASAKKVAAQVVTLTATSSEAATSRESIANTVQGFNQISPELIKNAKVELQSVGTQTEPSKNALNSKTLALIGALLGLASAISIIAVSRYFKL